MDKIPPQSVKDPADRRKAPRIPLLVRVECRTPNTYVLGHCENVSETGMLIFAKEIFPEGSDVLLRFDLPPRPKGPVIQTPGVVMRAKDNYFMTVQFSRLQPTHRIAISQYIARFLAEADLTASSSR